MKCDHVDSCMHCLMSLPVLVYLYDFIFLSLLHVWPEHFCKYNISPPHPRGFSCAEMRLAKCITLHHKYQLNPPQDSMFLSFLPSWLRVDGITAQLQVSDICHSLLLQEAKNFTPSKNNIDLPSTVHFAIVIHADQDEKTTHFYNFASTVAREVAREDSMIQSFQVTSQNWSFSLVNTGQFREAVLPALAACLAKAFRVRSCKLGCSTNKKKKKRTQDQWNSNKIIYSL